ncbi:MAG: insulinase family protein [Vicingaceae bacterium]
MRTKQALVSLMALCVSAISFAQDKSEVLKPSDKVMIGKLDNGLTYYIRENEKPKDKLELRLVVNAGSILENDKQQGLAHFMEHMNFNGTKNFEKNDLVDYLQSIGVKFGADLNAYTSFDETVYILPIPSDDPEKLETGFQILEDWAHQANLTDEEIDKERGVVLEEYRLGLGANKRMMRDYLPKLLYGSRYAERLPIGKKDVLENFEYETLRNFYKDWYRPDLMAVIAVGDLSSDSMKMMIEKYFGDIAKPKNAKERKEYDIPNHDETFISVTSDKEAAFQQVLVVYKDEKEAKPLTTVGDYQDELKARLFGQMLNARFSEIGNEPNPPFTFASGYYGGLLARTKNAFQNSAIVGSGQHLAALETILTENKRVAEHGFTSNELERAKKQMMARMEKQYNDRDKQESGRIIGEYVRHFLRQEAIPGLEKEFELYQEYLEGIKLEEVNALIDNYLHNDNRVVVLMGDTSEAFQNINKQKVAELMKQVERSEVEAYAEEAIEDALISKLPAAGSIQDSSVYKDLNVTTYTLSNGLKVTYKKTDFKNDEIKFSAYSPGGMSHLSTKKYKDASMASNYVGMTGIGEFGMTDLQKFMSGKIASARPMITDYSEGMSGSAAPKDFEILMQMIHLYFTDLRKDEEAFDSFTSRMKGFMLNMMNMPMMYFQNEVGKIKNEGNERYQGFPTEEDFEKMDYNLAYEVYQERFADASDFHFFFVGNLDVNQLKEFSKTYLASLPTLEREDKPKYNDFRPKDEQAKHIIKKGEDPKSYVQLSWEEEVNYDDYNRIAVRALGEVFSIKLIESLREEASGVYSASARGSLRKYPYGKFSLSISFPCGPENVDSLVQESFHQVKLIKEEGIAEKDLDKVKENLLLKYKEDKETNDFWVSALNNAARYDRDFNSIMKYQEKVKALTVEDLNSLAKEFLDDNYFLAIKMPEDKKDEE